MEVKRDCEVIQTDVDNIHKELHDVDKAIEQVMAETRSLSAEAANVPYSYVTQEDARMLPGQEDQTVIAIRAPP
ncbi:E2FA, partial [Symbiodinium sp. KB8]